MQDQHAGDDAEPTGQQRRRQQPGDGIGEDVDGKDAGRIGAGAVERGMAQRDDTGKAERHVQRQREQHHLQDRGAETEIARRDEIGREREQPGNQA